MQYRIRVQGHLSPDLSRPLWGTLHRAAGGWHHAALGDAPGSGRALWGALTAHPAWAGAALVGNERDTRRRGAEQNTLEKASLFFEKNERRSIMTPPSKGMRAVTGRAPPRTGDHWEVLTCV